MDQRSFTILFIVITILAVVVLAFSQFGGFFNKSEQVQETNSLVIGQQSSDPVLTRQSILPTMTNSAQKQIKQYKTFKPLEIGQLKDKKAIIQTKKGDIELEIYPEATKAASNFIFLAGEKFYDGLTFHRVEPGFVIQGGDPVGNGTGGPGYKFEDEPVLRKYDKGMVAMANSGPNTNGSQFFIMLEDNPSLPPKYTIFGKVTKGMSVVENIKVGDVMERVAIR